MLSMRVPANETDSRSVSALQAQSKAAGLDAPGHSHVLQRKITVNMGDEMDEELIEFEPEGALEMLNASYPEMFDSEIMFNHRDSYLTLLAMMSKSDARFKSLQQFAEALETERREQIKAYHAKDLKKEKDSSSSGSDKDSVMKEVPKKDKEKMKLDEEPVEYDQDAIAQYRFSMAFGSRWGSEAEATVIADSLGVRFRIYTFDDDNITHVPRSNIIVGTGGPVYALHYTHVPGHYSLLEPDDAGPYHLNGRRYRFVPIPKDGHCLFGAGFRAVTGRSATPEDIRDLRAVAASMVPDEVVTLMLIQLGYNLQSGKKKKDEKKKDKEDEPKSSGSKDKQAVKELQPFMSRINYLLNRYPNLFYGVRSQHSDFGQIWGGFSETRQLFFYNDMLVSKLPVELMEDEEDIRAEEPEKPSKMDISPPLSGKGSKQDKKSSSKQEKIDQEPKEPKHKQQKKQEQILLPDLDTFIDKDSGDLDVDGLKIQIDKTLQQMQQWIKEVDPEMRKGKEDQVPDESDKSYNFNLVVPEELEDYETMMLDSMKHHNISDEFLLGKIPFQPPVKLDDSSKEKKHAKKEKEEPEIPFVIPDASIPFEEVEFAKSFARNYQYSSNDANREKYLLSRRQDSQRRAIVEARLDKALIALRKNKLKYNEKHAEQLLVSGMAWEAITSIALEKAYREATTRQEEKEKKESSEKLVLIEEEEAPNIKSVSQVHRFTIVINRTSCPSCTDALIAAIRIFWQACADLFGLETWQEAQQKLGHIFIFEMSVTGMYVSGDESTTANDLEALKASGWRVGLHHDKSGGLSPQGYAFVEALFGKHDQDEIDKMAGKGTSSVKSISMSDKLEIGKIRKLKKMDLLARGPENRITDVSDLTRLLNDKKSNRDILSSGNAFIKQAIEELRNYGNLSSDAFEKEAYTILEAMNMDPRVQDQSHQTRISPEETRKILLKCLGDIYDAFDKHRTDKQQDSGSKKK